MDAKIDRRSFLSASAKLAVACCFLPYALEASEGKASEDGAKAAVDLADAANAPLKEPGGAVFLNVKGEKRPLIVWRESESSIKAFNSACTHKGVQIELPKGGIATCPAHGAQFDKSGKPVRGPAKSSLKEFKATLSGSIITIDLKV